MSEGTDAHAHAHGVVEELGEYDSGRSQSILIAGHPQED